LRRHTRLPIAVGFGIKDADSARAVAELADAVVIGSALVECLQSCKDAAEASSRARDFIMPLRAALDARRAEGHAANG